MPGPGVTEASVDSTAAAAAGLLIVAGKSIGTSFSLTYVEKVSDFLTLPALVALTYWRIFLTRSTLPAVNRDEL